MSVKVASSAPPPLRFAAHGILAEGAGSGAGSFPVLFAELLARGHAVDFFGVRGFTEPKSLERFANYRFVGLRLETLERWWWRAAAWKTPYPLSAISQLAALGFQREAMKHIETDRRHYDLVVCTDAQAFWRSSLPVVSWPQSPPHTEAAALRKPDIRRRVLAASGLKSFTAVQGFYAYRRLAARLAANHSDVYLCGSRWALEEWSRFGVDRARLRASAYLVDLKAFSDVPPLGSTTRPPTLLWLGRATPRKRLDLFLEAFTELRRRFPEARARLVGNLRSDPFAAKILEGYAGDPAISVEEPIARARVPELFGTVDVLVQPSENENFGFSIAEALGAGRPVVAGPTNGTLDYAGSAGFAFDAYRPERVAAAMERALGAVRAGGAELSAQARAAARQFEPERVVAGFEDICQKLVGSRPRAPAR